MFCPQFHPVRQRWHGWPIDVNALSENFIGTEFCTGGEGHTCASLWLEQHIAEDATILDGWSANRKLSRNVRSLSELPRKNGSDPQDLAVGSFDRVV